MPRRLNSLLLLPMAGRLRMLLEGLFRGLKHLQKDQAKSMGRIKGCINTLARQVDEGRDEFHRGFRIQEETLMELRQQLDQVQSLAMHMEATTGGAANFRMVSPRFSGVNYFAYQTAAERYAKDRPYFHPLVIERIRTFLKLSAPVPVALDVGCGTGQSALALAEIAASVIACDSSASMLSLAPHHERIRYIEAPAERLPVANECADLMTVARAFHWFDRDRFLAEAHRVLRPGGMLVIYGNQFSGRMSDIPGFGRWLQECYFARYPLPRCDDRAFRDDDARISGFVVADRETYTNDVSFTPEQLVRYFMTQSNVIAAVEQRGESPPSAYSWLLESISPLFTSPAAEFIFGSEIIFLQKTP